ncbi:MAG: hypothetical protein DWH86_01735 [Planctomycetota bacterium]|nr:MAG: hypothetical protein DWH86_01735 [Planctomycetota bacterium]
MSPSQFAATNILPLLARIVLCLAFLPQGWNNLMRDVEYTAHDAQRLRELGVRGITDPDPKKSDVALGAIRGFEAFESAEWQTAPTLPPPRPGANGMADSASTATPLPGTKPATVTPPAGTTAQSAPIVPTSTPATVPAVTERPSPLASPLAPLTQRGLYTLSLLVDRARIPFPIEIAWAVAGIQLVGGACVLLGLFSRVWGLLMSLILAALFVMTSLPIIKSQGAFTLGAEQQNLILAQLGLFVLALGAFLVGPGAMSLDRAIFRRSKRGSPKRKSSSA